MTKKLAADQRTALAVSTLITFAIGVPQTNAESADTPAPTTRRETTHRHPGAERHPHEQTARLKHEDAPTELPASAIHEALTTLQDGADEIASNWEPLAEHGIQIEGSLILDHTHTLKGGLSTNGTATAHLLDIGLIFDMDLIAEIPDAAVYVNFQNHNGEDPTEDVGDAQEVTNIVADGRTQIAEFWYEQFFAEGTIRFVFGKRDANAEFAFVDYGGVFLNGSFGVSPTVLELPTYPDPATGVLLFFYPGDREMQDVHQYFGIGVFDGSLHEGVRTGSRGPSTFFSSPADMFIIGEAGLTWGHYDPEQLPGRLAVGGWGHTGTFENFSGSDDDGTEGFYIVMDQMLWPENPDNLDDEQGIAFFFQYGYADPDVSEIEHHFGAGVQFTGPIHGRDGDTAGIGISAVIFSDDAPGFPADEEIAFEAFYEAHLAPLISIQPDIQYIINPGGQEIPDAVVGTIRTIFEF